VYFEDASFAEQVGYMNAHDLLVSPHGAQLWGIPFMPICSGILEIFPNGYYLDTPAALAAAAGSEHMHIMLSARHGLSIPTEQDHAGEGNMNYPNFRFHARETFLCPSPTGIVSGVWALAWQRCSCMDGPGQSTHDFGA